MKHHTTHCALRLGDNLAALHFLRKLSGVYPDDLFTHFCHQEYFEQLCDVVADSLNIRLMPFGVESSGPHWGMEPTSSAKSVNLWKNAGGFFDRHPNRFRYSQVMLDWFREAARQLGLESPLLKREDLLFDYPALRLNDPSVCDFDFLIINSPPLSGQAGRFDAEQMDRLILRLRESYRVITTFRRQNLDVPCTMDFDGTVTSIGRLSQMCKAIVMVSTGPSWPTFNVWNRETVKLRIIINEPEFVDLDPNAIHVPDVVGVAEAIHTRTALPL